MECDSGDRIDIPQGPPDILDDRQSQLQHLDEQNFRHQRRYAREAGLYSVVDLAIEVYETWRDIVNTSAVSQRDDIVRTS